MRLQVTTPRGSLVDTDVDEVTGPGQLGEFGVLPSHIPFLSALKPGTLTYKGKDGVRVVAVSAGLLQIARTNSGDHVQVLVEDAQPAREIDRTAAEQEAAALDREIAGWTADLGAEYQALRARRAWAQARIDAASRA